MPCTEEKQRKLPERGHNLCSARYRARRRSTCSATTRVQRVLLCLLQQHGPQVSVVGFRAALRVGLGSRVAAGHCPIWQHLGMSRQQRNIAKATLRFLRYSRTSAEIGVWAGGPARGDVQDVSTLSSLQRVCHYVLARSVSILSVQRVRLHSQIRIP